MLPLSLYIICFSKTCVPDSLALYKLAVVRVVNWHFTIFPVYIICLLRTFYLPFLRGTQRVLFEGYIPHVFYGHTICPFWETNYLPFMRDILLALFDGIQLALFEEHTTCPLWETYYLPFSRDILLVFLRDILLALIRDILLALFEGDTTMHTAGAWNMLNSYEFDKLVPP